MSDWYFKQFGDTSVLAISISFGRHGHEPDDTGWGSFALWVRNRCLTRSIDDSDGTPAQAVRWHLAEILSWLRSSAVRLMNEEPLPVLAPSASEDFHDVRDACAWVERTEDAPSKLSAAEQDEWYRIRSEWRDHHSLRRAATGVALPNVYLRRLGERVEVSWDNETWGSPRPSLRFLEQRGTEFVDARVFADVLHGALTDATDALRKHSAASQKPSLPVQGVGPSDWKWLIHAATAEAIRRDLPQLAQRLDWHAERNERHGFIPHSPETLVLRQARLCSGSDVTSLLAGVREPVQPLSEILRKLVRRSVPSTIAPWKEGYQRALEVRETLGWGQDPMPDPESWLSAQNVHLEQRSLPSDIVLLSLVAPDERAAAITINPNSSSRQRREIAYTTALAHILLDVDFVAVDGPWEHWPSAARARAFAIMLQLPDDGVRELLPSGEVRSVADVLLVMQRFNTGPRATTYHLRNRRFIASDDKRDDILRELLSNV